MGWPTIADSVLLKNIKSDPAQIAVAKATDISDGTDKLVLGPWWCRDLAPEYVTDFVWNPIAQNLHVDLSSLTDLSWMNKFQTDCISTGGFTPANAFPAGQPVLLTYWPYATKCWRYQLDLASPGRRIEVVCGRIENLAYLNFPPICYALGIFVTIFAGGYGCIWFGIKSGNDPRGEYVMMCTNSARPVQWNGATGEIRVYYATGGHAPTPQLCPCNIEYTPQIYSFTVTD